MDGTIVEFIPVIMNILIGAFRIIEVLLIFSILVIGHEYGHFLVAKASGMRIDEFAIGFGKNLFSWKRGETVYSINLIPIGGYNKIYGMDVEDKEEENERKLKASVDSTDNDKSSATIQEKVSPDYSIAPRDDPRAFVNFPLWKRFFVVLAGPVANILIAILVVFIMGISIGFPAAELGGVIPGGPAEGAGLMKNDIITHLNDVRLASTSDLHQAIIFSNGQPLHLEGTRGNEEIDVTIIPQPIRLVDSHFCRIGFVYLNDGTIVYIAPGSPAERAGLSPLDIIIEVDGMRFPSHRLEIDSGNGVLRLKIYRGYKRSIKLIDFFDDEINRDNYSPFMYFYDDERVITDVIAGGIAGDAGLRPGDKILGGELSTWVETISGEHAQAPKETTIEYERDEKVRFAKLTPDMPFSRIQVYMDDAAYPVLVGLPYDHRLYLAGLRSGDEIASIEGVPTPNGITAFLEFQRHYGENVTIVTLSDEEERVFTVPIPSENDPDEVHAFFSGLHFKIRYHRADPISSMIAGVRKSYDVGGFIFMMIGMLISGQASVGDLAGPVGIATITYEAASSGLVDLINIMVLLSINLAIFNLLPFPALDGGRMLFMFFEAIFRRPVVNVRVENLIHIAGFLLLIMFALFVTYHDVVRLIFGR